MLRQTKLIISVAILACFLQAQGADKYTDENRPYEFGFTIDGEQHRHEKKDENGLIMGEFGFITADGVYHVTVYATDENGNFKILSMKNIRVKPYPTAPQKKGHSLPFPPSGQTSQAQGPSSQTQPISFEPPAMSCSHCSIPTTTKAPELTDLSVVSVYKPAYNLQSPQYSSNSQDSGTPQYSNDAQDVNLQNAINAQYPADAQYPGNSQYPENAQYPGSAQYPQDAQYPGNAQYPENTQYPGDAQYPGNAQYPENTQHPDSQNPSNVQYPQENYPQKNPEQASQGGERNPKQYDQVPPPGAVPAKPLLISAQMQIVDKNTDIYQKGPGEKDGLPSGLNKNDMELLLYTFNYTVGFHGHHEEGYTNGAKKGYYYVTGRNGVRTRVDYVADEKGFRPKITQEVLDLLSDDVPKPETEKEERYGLKGYQFKWIYYPIEH